MKKNVPLLTALLLVSSVLTGACVTSCGTGGTADTTETEEATVSVTEEATVTGTEEETEIQYEITPKEGVTVSLLNDIMTEWINSYKRGRLDKIYDHTERCEPVPVHFSWGGDAEYTNLFISENPDMSDPVVFLCSGSELDVEDLLPGTEYFWQTVCTKDGNDIRSDIHSFKTLQTIRTVYIPGVSNVRDLGGKKTSDGRRVKYGMVYRGADFANLTDEGIKKAVDILGIKTELDLREKVTGGVSPLGKDIKYISVTAPYYEKIELNEYKDDLLAELKAFVDPDNFPIYFHCSLGRDRTGTLAVILQALLGVSENDIYMDYEASFFSDMGGYADTTPPSTMLQQLNNLKGIISRSAKLLQYNTRTYLLNLGMTEKELDAICENLLEDVK
ncbi:MAG: tyrosine-protein phosphatase [Clostridia bacterium]|nr:tyrosine-protein phosphatase [Clostridia bacterium]